MSSGFFSTLPLWAFWFSVAVLLMAGEIMTFGFVLFWFSVGAAIVGVLTLFFPELPYWIQISVFSITSISFLLITRQMIRKKRRQGPQNKNEIHDRRKNYIGRSYHIEKDFIDGIGKLHIDDTQWLARGDNVKAGMRVKVIRAEGNTLFVEEISKTL